MRQSSRRSRRGVSLGEATLILAAVGTITLMAIDVLSQPVEGDVALYAVTPAQATMDTIELDIEQREDKRRHTEGEAP